MTKLSTPTSETPHILVHRVGSDLNVRCWDRAEVVVSSKADSKIQLEKKENILEISCPLDCTLSVPHGASLEVEQVDSGARIKNLEGELKIDRIGTDLVLRDVGTAKVNFVGSSLTAKRVRGDLQVQQIGSNAVIRNVDGQFNAGTVGGNLHLRGVSGGITADVGGSANAEFSPVPWQAYTITAGGNVRCQVPVDTNADFDILSGGLSIQVKTPEFSGKLKEDTYSLKMGDGGTDVKLAAGGSVQLTAVGSDWDMGDGFDVDFGMEIGDMADEIALQATMQIESQLEMLGQQLDTQLSGLSMSLGSAGLSEERAQHLQERLEQARLRAAQRAEEAAQRAQAKLERRIAASQRKVDRKARTAVARAARKERKRQGMPGYHIPTAPRAPRPPRSTIDPVTEDERMMILGMLQEKKISVEEAEKLLAALEGK